MIGKMFIWIGVIGLCIVFPPFIFVLMILIGIYYTWINMKNDTFIQLDENELLKKL